MLSAPNIFERRSGRVKPGSRSTAGSSLGQSLQSQTSLVFMVGDTSEEAPGALVTDSDKPAQAPAPAENPAPRPAALPETAPASQPGPPSKRRDSVPDPMLPYFDAAIYRWSDGELNTSTKRSAAGRADDSAADGESENRAASGVSIVLGTAAFLAGGNTLAKCRPARRRRWPSQRGGRRAHNSPPRALCLCRTSEFWRTLSRETQRAVLHFRTDPISSPEKETPMTNPADRNRMNLDRYQAVTPGSGGSHEGRRPFVAPARARKPRRWAGWGMGIPLEWLEARALLSVTPTSISVAAPSSSLVYYGQNEKEMRRSSRRLRSGVHRG